MCKLEFQSWNLNNCAVNSVLLVSPTYFMNGTNSVKFSVAGVAQSLTVNRSVSLFHRSLWLKFLPSTSPTLGLLGGLTLLLPQNNNKATEGQFNSFLFFNRLLCNCFKISKFLFQYKAKGYSLDSRENENVPTVNDKPQLNLDPINITDSNNELLIFFNLELSWNWHENPSVNQPAKSDY